MGILKFNSIHFVPVDDFGEDQPCVSIPVKHMWMSSNCDTILVIDVSRKEDRKPTCWTDLLVW